MILFDLSCTVIFNYKTSLNLVSQQDILDYYGQEHEQGNIFECISMLQKVFTHKRIAAIIFQSSNVSSKTNNSFQIIDYIS